MLPQGTTVAEPPKQNDINLFGDRRENERQIDNPTNGVVAQNDNIFSSISAHD